MLLLWFLAGVIVFSPFYVMISLASLVIFECLLCVFMLYEFMLWSSLRRLFLYDQYIGHTSSFYICLAPPFFLTFNSTFPLFFTTRMSSTVCTLLLFGLTTTQPPKEHTTGKTTISAKETTYAGSSQKAFYLLFFFCRWVPQPPIFLFILSSFSDTKDFTSSTKKILPKKFKKFLNLQTGLPRQIELSFS